MTFLNQYILNIYNNQYVTLKLQQKKIDVAARFLSHFKKIAVFFFSLIHIFENTHTESTRLFRSIVLFEGILN